MTKKTTTNAAAGSRPTWPANGTRLRVRTTTGQPMRVGGIRFTPEPTEVEVQEEGDPERNVIGSAALVELLEAARPERVPNPIASERTVVPFVASNSVLAVEHAVTGERVFAPRDAAMLALMERTGAPRPEGG